MILAGFIIPYLGEYGVFFHNLFELAHITLIIPASCKVVRFAYGLPIRAIIDTLANNVDIRPWYDNMESFSITNNVIDRLVLAA